MLSKENIQNKVTTKILLVIAIIALTTIAMANTWEMKLPEGKFLSAKYSFESKGFTSDRLIRKGTAEYTGDNKVFWWSKDETVYLNITANLKRSVVYTGADFATIDGDVSDYLKSETFSDKIFVVSLGVPASSIYNDHGMMPYLGFYIPQLELYKSKYGEKKIRASIRTYFIIDYYKNGDISKIYYKHFNHENIRVYNFSDYTKVNNISVAKKIIVEHCFHDEETNKTVIGEIDTYKLESANLVDYDKKLFELQYFYPNTGILDYRSKFKEGKEPLNYIYMNSSKSLDETSQELYNETRKGKKIFNIVKIIVILTLIFIVGYKIKVTKKNKSKIL